MPKRLTLLLIAMMFLTTVMANTKKRAVRNEVGKNDTEFYTDFDRGGLVETVILSEDFSKFTAGSEDAPDGVRLDDIETTEIDDAYFNSPGWSGIEIYQAGGCAYIGFSNEYGEPGLISTPLINTEGAIYIKCRMKSENPEGEIVGYNIVDEAWESIDSNVDFIEITQEWTDVTWFTTSGCENSYIYIFSYSSNVFIDDIEIVSCSMPTPTLYEETNITKNAFTANWESVDNIDTYLFQLFVDHTATTEECFYYTNTDFSKVDSKGTIFSPESVDGWETTIDGWHLYMPVLIDEAIGVTGRYSSIEQFGTITSPVSDFSSDNGKVNISFKAYGNINDILEINLITPSNGYYDIACNEKITIEKEGWNDYSVTLTKGMEESYIDITYFGLGDIFFDDLKLYQNISEGETKTLIIINTETSDTSYRATIDDNYINDDIYYQLAASKLVYSPNGDKEIGSIDSDFTEERHITLGDNSTPQEAETIAIGDGEINSYYAPISNYGNTANFSISQQIYTKDEINKESGSIKSISFHNNLGNSNSREIVVYMSNTKQEAYRDNHDWVLVKENEIVFDGTCVFASNGEWSTIELQNPFTYEGNSIAITIYDKSDTPLGFSGYDSFYASATDTIRGLYKTSSSKINVYNIEEIFGYELKTSVYATPANQYYINNIKMLVEPYSPNDEITINNPKNIAASAEGTSSIKVSWTSVKNATSYNIYRGNEKVANVTETSYLDENLDYNTEYCYTVRAVNGELESEKSNEACAKTLGEDIVELASSFSIYPNPANDRLYVETKTNVKEIAIYDIYGRQQTINKLSSDNSINIADLNAGIYFVKILTENGESVKRFVKK